MTWRHAPHQWSVSDGTICEDVPDIDGYACGCTTPTPDPTSPCGQLVRCCHLYEMPCGTAKDDHGGIAHRHLPTRCTCGHPIEEAPR